MKPGARRPAGNRPRESRPGGVRSARPRRRESAQALVLTALEQALELRAPADAVLRQFFRSHAELGRRDRGVIAETVFDVLRHRRRYAHFAEAGEGPLALRLAWLSLDRRHDGEAPAGSVREAGGSAAPRRDKADWPVGLPRPGERDRAWLARARATDPATLSPAVALSLPDALFEAMCHRFGKQSAMALGRALLEPAPLCLRANALRTDAGALVERLRTEGLSASARADVPGAVEVAGHPAIERSAAFAAGDFEVQDAGSQLLALLVGARRGQAVVDFCAGAGGKTLALAAAMQSTGQVFACDVSLARLQRLRPRLLRSGASNVQPFAFDSVSDPKLGRLAGRADAVLVDAPCTGTGTLRRNPDLKWRTGVSDLQRLVAEQRAILRAAARLVKPGGLLVYATCSLLAEENEAQAEWFEANFPRFEREDAAVALAAAGASLPANAFRECALAILPSLHNTDAFYGIRWRLTGKPGEKRADDGVKG